jgi:hypothetical protein
MCETAEPANVYARVVSAFGIALRALGASPPALVLERLGKVVHSSMSDHGRFYHRTEHVFDLFSTPEADPIATLSSLFHDTVCLTANPILYVSSFRDLLTPS